MYKTQHFILLLFAVFVFTGRQKSVLAQDRYSYQVWSDEFETPGGPDSDKWGYNTGGGGWGNNEMQTYTGNRNNSFVKDGKLYIKALKKEGKWTSARLVTKGKGDWLYGRIEVKAKLPIRRWYLACYMDASLPTGNTAAGPKAEKSTLWNMWVTKWERYTEQFIQKLITIPLEHS